MKDGPLIGVSLALTAALSTWAAVSIDGKSWLYALVVATLGVADLPAVAVVRRKNGWIAALVLHLVLLVAAWFVAFAVWAPFVRWE